MLKSIRDDDWWVRSRAADALGKIGGPQVIDAALSLVSDKDEEIRRTAIEILNQTKDERALQHLLEATKDADWWVSERAVDALGEVASRKSVPRLLEMLKSNPKSIPSVVRALGKIGDPAAIESVMQALDRPETDVRVEAMSALVKLADDRSIDPVRARIAPLTSLMDQSVAGAAVRALTELETRFGGTTGAGLPGAPGAPPTPADVQRTMLLESADVSAIMKQFESQARLDIGTLKPGDVLEGRYRYIERIGRGAFGTVLLMEDTVVDERLILKFLNPNISQDEEMMQRFVHELRYSRKITHPNVIRIYDFLHIRGLYDTGNEDKGERDRQALIGKMRGKQHARHGKIDHDADDQKRPAECMEMQRIAACCIDSDKDDRTEKRECDERIIDVDRKQQPVKLAPEFPVGGEAGRVQGRTGE
jgi:serine/threonine-protein kinase